MTKRPLHLAETSLRAVINQPLACAMSADSHKHLGIPREFQGSFFFNRTWKRRSRKGHTVSYTVTTVSINEEHLKLVDLGCSESEAMYILRENSVPDF
jgi:hypothetical protein